MKTVILKIWTCVALATGVTAVFVSPGSAALEQMNEQALFGTPPGVEKHEKDILKKFEKAKKIRGKDYRPRTKHTRPDGGAAYTNNTFRETKSTITTPVPRIKESGRFLRGDWISEPMYPDAFQPLYANIIHISDKPMARQLAGGASAVTRA